MNIVKGKQVKAQKAVFYGIGGIGKSTLASHLHNPLFIDTEGGTGHLDVARTQRPKSWSQYLEILRALSQDPMGFTTIVIDTADWAEKLAIGQVCSVNGVRGLGGGTAGNKDYGKSYNELERIWTEHLTMLEADLIDRGVHVVFLAHAKTRKFELPEEEGAFDRYEFDLEKKTSAGLVAWADMVLFLNYKTIVNVETSNSSGKITKAKGAGGTRRVCYAEHSAVWDAKNRHGLPEEFDLDIAKILPCFPKIGATGTLPVAVNAAQTVPKTSTTPPATATQPPLITGPRAKLADLMKESGVSWEELLNVMIARGKAAVGTPFEAINESLIDEWAIPYWKRVVAMVQEGRTANV